MQATFGKDGELKAKGKDAAPAVAEGLGASNIKGVEDSKTKTDIAHESGHDIVHDTPMTEKGMKPAYDPGSNTQGAADHATLPEGQPPTLGHNN
ncbi:g2311 [Coccomyxa elongata]